MKTCAPLLVVALVGLAPWLATAAETTDDPAYTPPAVTDRTDVRFPPVLLMEGWGEGMAVVLLALDDEGQLRDAYTLEANHPAFGKELISAAWKWSFAPARYADHRLPSRIRLEAAFTAAGVVVNVAGGDHIADHMRTEVTKGPEYVRAWPLAALDEPPRLRDYVEPVFPPELTRPEDGMAEVMVDYVIDPDGRVRVPAVVTAFDIGLARNVLDAVRQWRFTPAMRNGKAVAVQVRQPIQFQIGGNDSSSAETSPDPAG